MASTFEVRLTTIDKIWKHPTADRIELASVAGAKFQFCIQKGVYKEGDEVVYFPVDSIMPQWIIDQLDLWGKDENGNVIRDPVTNRVNKTFLVGEGQNRLRTAMMRGEVSQGMVCPLSALANPSYPLTTIRNAAEQGILAKYLGVTKYDAPESVLKGAKLLPFPDGVTPFDVEGADTFPGMVDLLMDIPVWITEKIEGTNHALVRLPADNRHAVCARNNEVEEIPGEDPYPGWEAIRNRYAEPWQILLEQVPRPEFPAVPVAIRGELFGPGIPKNFYPVKQPTFRCFAIKVGPNYLNAEDVCRIIPEHMRVPTLAYNVTLREWLNGRTVREASDGKSLIAPDKMREGIVIVPMVEQKVEWPNGAIKRLMLKQRSPKYLAHEKD